MRWLLLGLVLISNLSCATLANRRVLYRPKPDDEIAAQTSAVTTSTTVTTTRKNVPRSVPQSPGPITPEEEPVLPPP